jgi:hypothetical protein
VAHLSHEGLLSLAFVKNALLEMMSLDPEPSKSPQPKTLTHFLFPTGNLSFQDE